MPWLPLLALAWAAVVLPVSVVVIAARTWLRGRTPGAARVRLAWCGLLAVAWLVGVYAVAGGSVPWGSDLRGGYRYQEGDVLVWSRLGPGSRGTMPADAAEQVYRHLSSARRLLIRSGRPVARGTFYRDGEPQLEFEVSATDAVIVGGRSYQASPELAGLMGSGVAPWEKTRKKRSETGG